MNQESLIEKFLVPGYKVLFLFRSAESFYHAGGPLFLALSQTPRDKHHTYTALKCIEKWYGEVAWRCQWTKHYGNGTTEWVCSILLIVIKLVNF